VERLNKYLAQRLGLSRREADDYILNGKVTVNGQKARIGQQISPEDVVTCDEKKVQQESKFVYLALNKPEGYVSSRKRQGSTPTLYELLPPKYQTLKTVGRLDKNSSGLILLTNDGDFNYRMTHPKFIKTKVYEVSLDAPLAPLHQQMIADFGIQLPDGKSQLGLEKMNDVRRDWIVTMTEGRNRQIRRTFAALGYTVTRLHRTDFGPYKLADLESGHYTEITKLN